jgi:hypothetical protein
MTTIAQQLTAAADRFFAHEPIVAVASEATAPRTQATAMELLGNAPGIWTISVRRNGRVRWNERLALRALARAGAAPAFQALPEIIITVRVEGTEHADYSLAEWLAKTDFGAEMAELDHREAAVHTHNQAVADAAAQHPANIAAVNQMAREAEIVERLPTAQVDQWVIDHMGYTAETLAALGKATRRDRRREARQQMMAARAA